MEAAPTPCNWPLLRLAGWLWLIAGLSYLAAEAVAAAWFPGYSYAGNYISDLGVPYDSVIDGRAIHSPLAPVMNFGGFILDGLLSAAATVAATIALGTRHRASMAFLGFGLIHALGSVIVGTVHSGARELAAGTQHIHVIGAAMAIIAGNAALICAASLSPKPGPESAYRIASMGLGLFGLIGLALLEANRAAGLALAPDGIFERASVYAITGWKIMTGLILLMSRPASGFQGTGRKRL